MKRKFTVFIAGLLLAVGWATTAQAQLLRQGTVMPAPASFAKWAKKAGINRHVTVRDLVDEQVQAAVTGAIVEEAPARDNEGEGSMLRAPRRATYNETADAVHEFAWYDTITYRWSDGTGTYVSKITEPATNPAQMAYLVGSTYMNPKLPGIKYSIAWQADHPYYPIERGYNIPANARWYLGDGTSYPVGNITITTDNGNFSFQSIQVKSGNTVLTEWSYASNGTNLPTSWSRTTAFTAESTNSCYMSGGGTITINSSLLQGATAVTVEIYGRHDPDYTTDVVVTVAGSTGTSSSQTLTQSNNSEWATYTWNVSGTSSSTASSVTPPIENGYTVFLVKVKDGVTYDKTNHRTTSTWDEVVNIFDTYIDGIELLTDGVRVGGTTSNAGTVFTYTGNLNRFYFISKGKLCYMNSSGSLDSQGQTGDIAPFYGMYEEFSPTTTAVGDSTDNFFERMDQGEAYGIIHDCQGVNYLEHYFSMSNKSSSDHQTLSNLVFYIPDDRGWYDSSSSAAWRNYDHQPRVGLYTAELEATATPNRVQEHVYDVNIHWSTSLQTILGFDEPETHDLWVVVKDPTGAVVLDSLLTTTADTTYTYQVPQYPEGYTIDYIVRAWPTAADEPIDHSADSDGTFFADSDPDEVLIPGYQDFISLIRRHYESDFSIDEELNYYRNFMSLSNTNERGLTAADVDAGHNTMELWRYDDGDTTATSAATKVATLTFSRNTADNTMMDWELAYLGQVFYHGHTPTNKYEMLTQGDNPIFPRKGSFKVGTTGSTVNDTTYEFVDSINFYYDCTKYIGSFTVNKGNWSSPSNAMYMNNNGYAYINSYSSSSNYLQYTVPAGINNDTMTFWFYLGTSGNAFYFTKNGSELGGLATSNTGWFGVDIPGLNAGDVLKIYGANSSVSSYANSPSMWRIEAYKQVVTEVAAEGALMDMSGITIVDQFTASTANDTHPYSYSYRILAPWDQTLKSNLMDVPVKHTGATLNGYYTFEEMINDVEIPESKWLPINIKNGDMTTVMGGDAEIYFNTIGRKEDTENAWTRMSYMQFDNNHIYYSEGVNVLPDYTGQVAYPGEMIERLDYTPVRTGGYNSHMNYVPVVWTYGYDRLYFNADNLPSSLAGSATTYVDGYHNSYGAPIWKTGVGKVENIALTVQRQTDKNGNDNQATTWTDEYGNTCNIYFLGVTADGVLPTMNLKGATPAYDYNYYEPYMFRVWVKSTGGNLRGFSAVTGTDGEYAVNDPTGDHNLQLVWEEYTDDTHLDKSLPKNYVNSRNIVKFGALKALAPTDLEVIVRFYYKVKHLDAVDETAGKQVTLDFTAANNDGTSAWGIEAGNTKNWQTGTKEYTYDGNTVTLSTKYYYNQSLGYLMLGGPTGTLTLPAFDHPVKQIQVVGRAGASSSVRQNIYVGTTAVSTEVTGATGTATFDIAEDYQTVGTIYTLKVLNDYNSQIEKVIVIFADEETSGTNGMAMSMRAPKRAESGSYSHTFASGQLTTDGGNVTLSDVDWTTSTAAYIGWDSNNSRGVQIGSQNSVTSSYTLSTTGIPGTIKSIAIGANSYASNSTIGVTVGGAQFGGEAQAMQTGTTLGTNTFTGSASGEIVITMTNATSGARAMYIRSIDITYETDGGGEQTETYTLVSDIINGDNFSTNSVIAPEAPWSANGVYNQSENNLYVRSGGSLVFTVPEGYSNDTFKFVFSTCSSFYVGSFTFTPSNGTAQTVATSAANTVYECVISGLSAGETVTITGVYGSNTYSPDFKYMYVYVLETGTTPVTPTAELTVTSNNVNVGTSTPAANASTEIGVNGSNLTGDLTVAVSDGFSVSPATIPAAQANAGATVTVTYTGTDANATGTLTITSSNGEVSTVTVNLTASYDAGTTPVDPDQPVLNAPTNGSNINVGVNQGEGISRMIEVSGENLTQDLTVTLTSQNEGFAVSAETISAADANAGTTLTITYTGTDENATATLVISSGEVSSTVTLTAAYHHEVVVLTEIPAGYVVQESKSPEQIVTSIIETLFGPAQVEEIGKIYINTLGMQSDVPFDGVNIVVTRYSDGTTKTTKVVK